MVENSFVLSNRAPRKRVITTAEIMQGCSQSQHGLKIYIEVRGLGARSSGVGVTWLVPGRNRHGTSCALGVMH